MRYNIIREFCKRPLAKYNTEMYSRGRRGAPAKGVGRVTGARVQISPSPPEKSQVERLGFFLIQAAGLAYHHASACISSPKAYIITQSVYPLRLDDIPQQVADDIQGLRLDDIPPCGG